MLFLALSDEDQKLVDAEEIPEENIDLEQSDKCITVVKQRKINENKVFSKVHGIRKALRKIFSEIINLPFSMLSFFLHCTLDKNNEFISIP